MSVFDYEVFVPNDTAGDRKNTAILLIGTAREFGVDTRAVKATQGGFFITAELADLVFDETEPEPEPEPKPAKKAAPKKTSGNRAEKNNTTTKE